MSIDFRPAAYGMQGSNPDDLKVSDLRFDRYNRDWFKSAPLYVITSI